MLVFKPTGTVFKDRKEAKAILGTKRYHRLVLENKIEFIENSNK